MRPKRFAFISKRLRRSPRVADVFAVLMADKPDADAWLEAQALQVAELTVAAEELRARLATMMATDRPDDKDPVRSLATLINSVTRLASTARRAAADLGKVTHVEPDPVAALRNHFASKRSDDDSQE
jgi:hypothetical protein